MGRVNTLFAIPRSTQRRGRVPETRILICVRPRFDVCNYAKFYKTSVKGTAMTYGSERCYRKTEMPMKAAKTRMLKLGRVI